MKKISKKNFCTFCNKHQIRTGTFTLLYFVLPAHLIIIAVVVFALSVSMVFPGSFLMCGVVHKEAASGPTSITNTSTCEVFIWECWFTTSDLTTELSINSLEGQKEKITIL